MVSVIIPAKGNSTRIEKKNLQEWRGKPLLLWSIEYAQSEGYTPYVVTESQEVKEYAQRCGAVVIDEPEELTNCKYQLLVEWIGEKLETDLIFIPCTSPLRRPGLVREAVEKLKTFDSVMAGAKLPAQFVCDKRGKIVNRQMDTDGKPPYSQGLVDDPHYLRTGSLFGVRYPAVRNQNDVVFGKWSVIDVPWRDTVDIDWPEDLESPRAVVVGNAASLSNRKVGWLIDGYDVVVRTNYYRVDGHEKSVGTKTTHWAIVCTGNVGRTIDKTDCSNYVEVWARFNGNEEDYESVCSKLKDYRNLKRITRFDQTNNFPLWIEDRRRLSNPTTGLVAIAEAIDRWGKIDIAGFGPADRYEEGYYWQGIYTEEISHNYELERIILNEWEQAGYVRRIDQ